MPRIAKLGNISLTSYEADRIPNISLGRNCRIKTNNVLKKDPKLSQFFNNETMGALDNYAEHKNLKIYITPLENDMFNDVEISVFKNHNNKAAKFPINVAKNKEEIPTFFRELYNKIQKITNQNSNGITDKVIIKKPTFFSDLKMYIENVIDRYNDTIFELTERLIK